MGRTTKVLVAVGALMAAAAVVTPAAAIVGGRTPAAAEGTYTVALLAADGSQFCGGSVIAPGWVLTAGHCAAAVNDDAVPGPISVAIGRAVLSDASVGQVHPVTQVLVHPAYDPARLVNDAALLQLGTATAQPPVRLAGPADDGYEAHGAPVRIYGWGRTLPELPGLGLTSTSDRLQVVDVPIVGDAQCAQQYGLLSALTGSVDGPNHVCAAALLKDSCAGDSGGPLVATTPDGDVQLGVVSFGFGCALPTHAGVYAEVNAPPIRSWISQVTGV